MTENIGCFSCASCGSKSPSVSEDAALETMEQIEDEAYLMATERFELENRVLTLEEVQSLAYVDYAQQHILSMECKSIIKQAENMFTPCVVAHEDLNNVGVLEIYDGANMRLKQKSTYGEHWRCWLRKPMKEEMEQTPWS